MTEAYDCPVCGEVAVKPAPGDYLRCTACGSSFPRNPPATGAVTNRAPTPPSGRAGLLLRDQLRVGRKLGRERRRIIDIGGGNGAFLKAALRCGLADHDSFLVEIDPPSVAAAQAADLDVRDELSEVTPGALVTLWHSAEHIPPGNLSDMLKRASACAEPRRPVDLIVATPSSSAWLWKELGTDYCYFDPESHLVQYAPDALENLLRASGFEVVSRPWMPTYGTFGIMQSMINVNMPRNALYLETKRSGHRVSPSMLLRSVAALARSVRYLPPAVLAETNAYSRNCIVLIARTHER